MPTLTTYCPLDCPDACSLDVTIDNGRVATIAGNHANPLTAGTICAKVRDFADHMYGPERVLRPAIRDGRKGSGRFRDVTWDEALERVATELQRARDSFGGESILPLCYGGSNGMLTQDAVDARLFRRLGASRCLRTACAAPTGAAAQGLYGRMPGVALPDYEHARLIVIWGCNPAASGIHLQAPIQRARQQGAKLIVVDPRRTRLAKQADIHLPVRPGTDLPVALSLIRWLFETGAADRGFLNAHTTGADRLAAAAAPWTFARAAAEAGVGQADLEAVARLYATVSPAVVRCGWGPERNRNAGSAVAAILALPAVAGKFGVRGGGYTMSNSPAFRDIDPTAASAEPEASPPPRAVNMNQLGRALTELDDPPVKVLFVYNANPWATLPAQQKIQTGMARDDLFTVVFDAVWTDSARQANVVLPATTFLEHHELGRGYGAMLLQRARPVVAPVADARPNYDVFADLVRRCGLARAGDPDGPDELVAALLQSTPQGPRLAAELASHDRAFPGCGPSPIQFVDVFPATPDRKAHLHPDNLDREAPAGLYGYSPDPATSAAPLALISPATSRTISSTFGQLNREQVPIELHPDDAAARSIATGDTVRVWNDLGEVVCYAAVNRDLRPGVAVLPKGLWSHNTGNGATVNTLCPDTLTDLGGGACFNDARVQIQKIATLVTP